MVFKMSAESFQLIVETRFDDSFLKSDYFKINHQQNAQPNEVDEVVEIFFGDNYK